MKKILNVLKIFAILLLVVGCGLTQSQSVTQQLAGEYVNYKDNGNENYTIILEEPKSKDDTSGNATYMLNGINETTYYGTYKVYESSKKVVIEYDDYSLSGDSIELTFDLENNTLTQDGHYSLLFEKQ
mgnify:CR=1 FL=1